MEQPEGMELTKLHFPAAWTSQSATNLRASVSGGWEKTINTVTLHWDYITDVGGLKCAFQMYTYILARGGGDCECVYVCVHSYPVSTKMTSVLNVQSLKLKLLPTLPLSVSLC